jgi:hypothetical protein
MAFNAASVPGQSISKRLTLDDLTKEADSVFIAKCTKQETVYRDGNIVSRYQMKPSEFWKSGPLRLSSAGEVTVEQLGGSLDSPVPLTQYNPLGVVLTEGQEVLMFTRMPDPQKEQQLAAQSGVDKPTISADLPRIVGGQMGVYSVIRNPETGQRLLAPGTVAGRLSEATVGKAIARTKQVERANAAAKEGSVATRAAAAETDAKRIRPFESLVAVKDRVQTMVKQSRTDEAAVKE